MKIVKTIGQVSEIISDWKKNGFQIGLVPTMGFLHEGHLALIRKSCELAEKNVTSIFVNPRQFGPNEDLDNYPRNMERDCSLAQDAGCDLLFAPPPEEMYPVGYQTNIRVTQLALGLCGKSRPGHFDGVATVVTKLFNIIQPDVAVFGQKDYQQLALIRQLVSDLNLSIEVIGHEIVRESDGLAMSSRNKYLDPEERKQALCLYKAICIARKCAEQEKSIKVDKLKDQLTRLIHATPSCRVDYIDIVDAQTLQKLERAGKGDILAMAVFINDKVRLIDNTPL